MRALTCTIIIASMALAGVATAQGPKKRPKEFGQVTQSSWGDLLILTTAGTEYSLGECFAHGSLVVIKGRTADAGFTCVWSGASTTSSIALGAYGGATQCQITDAFGRDGSNGACVDLYGFERHDQAPAHLKSGAPGFRGGLCTNTVVAPGGGDVYPPCSNPGDCSGTCTAAGSLTAAQLRQRAQQSCSYIHCAGDTNSQAVFFGVGK